MRGDALLHAAGRDLGLDPYGEIEGISMWDHGSRAIRWRPVDPGSNEDVRADLKAITDEYRPNASRRKTQVVADPTC
jgi:hypothetical protein